MSTITINGPVNLSQIHAATGAVSLQTSGDPKSGPVTITSDIPQVDLDKATTVVYDPHYGESPSRAKLRTLTSSLTAGTATTAEIMAAVATLVEEHLR